MRAKGISRRAFCLGAGASAVCMLVGCGRQGAGESHDEPTHDVKTLKVCAPEAFDYALCGYYIAKSQGLFTMEALDVVEVPKTEGATALETVNRGDVRLCFSSQDALVPLYAQENPASIEAVAAYIQPAYAMREGYQNLVVANDRFLVSHEEEAWAFLRALEQGYRYCAEQSVEAAHELALQFPALDLDECERELIALAPRILDDDGEWGSISVEAWDARNEALFDEGSIGNAIYTHHGFNLDYLSSAVSVK